MKTFLATLFFNLFSFVSVDGYFSGNHRLSQQEAVLILGEPCYLKTDYDSLSKGVQKYQSTYYATSGNDATKPIGLYYMFERYENEAEDRKTFEGFKTGNQALTGFEMLNNMGDQAFFHTDGKNFHLIIARKGTKMIRIKVNTITPKTSVEEMKKIAGEMITRV
jgi:hypothetical protein